MNANIKVTVFFLTIVLLLSGRSVPGQSQYKDTARMKGLKGKIIEMKLHDLRDTKNLTTAERRYEVNVVLDTAPDTILGFDLFENNPKIQEMTNAWYDFLFNAFMNGYEVDIRWESRAKIIGGDYPYPSYADILSVAVSKEVKEKRDQQRRPSKKKKK